jgi:hypothetical protein
MSRGAAVCVKGGRGVENGCTRGSEEIHILP